MELIIAGRNWLWLFELIVNWDVNWPIKLESMEGRKAECVENRSGSFPSFEGRIEEVSEIMKTRSRNLRLKQKPEKLFVQTTTTTATTTTTTTWMEEKYPSSTSGSKSINKVAVNSLVMETNNLG